MTASTSLARAAARECSLCEQGLAPIEVRCRHSNASRAALWLQQKHCAAARSLCSKGDITIELAGRLFLLINPACRCVSVLAPGLGIIEGERNRRAQARWLEIADKHAQVRGRMGLIITLIVFVGLAAIIVWVADWTSVGERRSTALDILNRRLARGEIDRAEYEEKRKLLGQGKRGGEGARGPAGPPGPGSVRIVRSDCASGLKFKVPVAI